LDQPGVTGVTTSAAVSYSQRAMRPFKSVVSALLLLLSAAALSACSSAESRANGAYDAGVALARDHKSAEALVKFDEAISLKRDHLPARLARAKALQDLKRHDEAIAEFDLVLRVDPGSVDALEGRGLSKEARQIGSGLDDLNAALRGPGTSSSQIPLLVTGVPKMMFAMPAPRDGSQAMALVRGGTPAVPNFGAYFKDVLERQRKTRTSPLKALMERLEKESPPSRSPKPPIDLNPIFDWAGMSDKEIDAKFEAIDRLSPKADLDKVMDSLDGITEFIKAGKKDPTKPATSYEWSVTFHAPAFLADWYNRPLVAYFPGTTDWKAGVKDLGALIPIANKADFYLANPDYLPTRDEVARTTQMFDVTKYPTLVVVRMKSPVTNGPKKEHLDTQVKCEGRPMSQCVQEVLAWFNAR
jgi:tetratricopeptide (TPR) repeat protein